MNTYQGALQLDALGDGSRREILALLSTGSASVGELADRLPISRPAVSQHLRVLEGAGLVQHRASGTRHLYSLDDSGVSEIRAFLAAFWRRDLEEFAAFVHDRPGDDLTGVDS